MHPDQGLRNGVSIFVFASVLELLHCFLYTYCLLLYRLLSASCFRRIAYVSARFQVFSQYNNIMLSSRDDLL